MFSPRIDALINSQPQWVWWLAVFAVIALAYRFGFFDKFKGGIKAPKLKSINPAYASYEPTVSAGVLEGLLPPAVVEMRKSTAAMKQQLADAVAAETEATVKEYTKYMTLTTGVALANPKVATPI